MAKRLIEYKQKISEKWLEKNTNNSNESEAEAATRVIMKLQKIQLK